MPLLCGPSTHAERQNIGNAPGIRWTLGFIYLFISFLVHSASAGHLLLVVKQAPAPVSLSLTHRRPCVSPIKGKPLPKNSKKNDNNGQHGEIIRRFVESKGDFLGEENAKELHQPTTDGKLTQRNKWPTVRPVRARARAMAIHENRPENRAGSQSCHTDNFVLIRRRRRRD